jgi:hypothetical protein
MGYNNAMLTIIQHITYAIPFLWTLNAT